MGDVKCKIFFMSLLHKCLASFRRDGTFNVSVKFMMDFKTYSAFEAVINDQQQAWRENLNIERGVLVWVWLNKLLCLFVFPHFYRLIWHEEKFTLTLDDVGDHEGGAGVVADEATAGEVAFNLQCEQIPGGKGKQRRRQKQRKDRERRGGEVNARFINSAVKSNSITCKLLAFTHTHTHGADTLHHDRELVSWVHVLPGRRRCVSIKKQQRQHYEEVH